MPTPASSTETFPYDVFLSHSAKDKAVVRPLAQRLRQDGLEVWFDEWIPSPAGAGEGGRRPGEGPGADAASIPAKIEEGLVLRMSAQAFGSDWAQLACPGVASGRRRKAGRFRFRHPLNQERRFIPLRLDDAPVKGDGRIHGVGECLRSRKATTTQSPQAAN